MKQIKQMAIMPDGGFDLLPASAKYIIKFGSAENYETKFGKLALFNENVLSKIGPDKYNQVDVRFDKQVVATRNGSSTKIDSLQTIRIIEKMITDATRVPEDSVFTPVEKNNAVINKADTTLPEHPDKQPTKQQTTHKTI